MKTRTSILAALLAGSALCIASCSTAAPQAAPATTGPTSPSNSVASTDTLSTLPSTLVSPTTTTPSLTTATSSLEFQTTLSLPSDASSSLSTGSEDSIPSSTSAAEPSPSGVIPADSSGKVLTLSDIFQFSGTWEESRYDIADKTQVPGLGVSIPYCRENSPAELELRLAHRFKTLTMNIGQANDSASSDLMLNVQIVANGSQQDSQRVPFDRIQAMKVDLTDVNALKIRLWLEGSACNQGAIAVISDLKVSG